MGLSYTEELVSEYFKHLIDDEGEAYIYGFGACPLQSKGC
jgi:hypothetical protein